MKVIFGAEILPPSFITQENKKKISLHNWLKQSLKWIYQNNLKVLEGLWELQTSHEPNWTTEFENKNRIKLCSFKKTSFLHIVSTKNLPRTDDSLRLLSRTSFIIWLSAVACFTFRLTIPFFKFVFYLNESAQYVFICTIREILFWCFSNKDFAKCMFFLNVNMADVNDNVKSIS